MFIPTEDKEKEKEKKEKEKDKDKEKNKGDAAQPSQLTQSVMQQQQQQQQQRLDNEFESVDENGEITVAQNNNNHNNASDDKVKSAEDGIGVPHIIVEDVNKSELDELYKHAQLPQLAEVLDGMGLGPRGPPIPPPATFDVVPFPAFRQAPPGSEFSHYVFVTTNENDP